eukprot:g22104.t1
MNVDNREYIFRVLNDLTKLPFLAEDKEGRQDVICARALLMDSSFMTTSIGCLGAPGIWPQSFSVSVLLMTLSPCRVQYPSLQRPLVSLSSTRQISTPTSKRSKEELPSTKPKLRLRS